jgi:hypothetical protein
MRRGTLFWGTILILAGILFLLSNLNIITVDVWGLLWPIFLVALGVWILFGTVLGRRAAEAEHANIPLEGAARARLRVNHGAGRIQLSPGTSDGDLVEGDFVGGLDLRTRREGDLLNVEMSIPVQFFPFGPWNWGPHGLDWNFAVNRDVPIVLHINTGAGEANLDLSELQVSELRLQTGASSSYITLPAHAGHTRADVEAGAASVRLTVPTGVAGRIRNRSGLSSVSIDTQRFPRQGDIYQSPDYDRAANKVDVEIKTGVGSVDIR